MASDEFRGHLTRFGGGTTGIQSFERFSLCVPASLRERNSGDISLNSDSLADLGDCGGDIEAFQAGGFRLGPGFADAPFDFGGLAFIFPNHSEPLKYNQHLPMSA